MRLTTLLATIALAFTFTCCTAQGGGVVDVPTLRAEMANGGVQLIDVRTPHEWVSGHIAGALHIDWFDDDFKERVARLDKERPVRLYCHGGGRSADARELLRGMGFTDVRDLDDGIQSWKAAGEPLEK
ncbi:MAG: rhodanese-like domain-containing protein [Flavobacteriales bacterium]|jgi:rhodanese-related sulfurtransferase|nr:rhodanese-like domain-containing protein [Flavobacteriales bacterium]